MKIDTLKSKVEFLKNYVKRGDVLIYCDNENYMRYEVIENFGDSVELNPLTENSNTEGIEDVYFNEMQIGWDFSTKTINARRELYDIYDVNQFLKKAI